MGQESREVELVTQPVSAAPDPQASYVPVRVPGEPQERWLRAATDADLTDAEMDFGPSR
jgi:hypothetical protein